MATHYKTSLEPLLKIPKDPGVRPAAIYENSTHVQCNGLQAHVSTCVLSHNSMLPKSLLGNPNWFSDSIQFNIGLGPERSKQSPEPLEFGI